MNRRGFLVSGATLCLGVRAASAEMGPFSGADEGRELKLDGLAVRLQSPRVVAESDKHNCWFPDLLKFSTGELMLNHSLNSDQNNNPHNSQAVYLSTDGGRSFSFAYDVNGFHNGGGEPRLSLPDGRIVGTSTFLKPDPPGQARRFAAHRWTYDRGGRRYAVEPWAAKVERLPRGVRIHPAGTSRTWWANINWFSDILPLAADRWLSTLSLRYQGDRLESTVALESRDEGRTWRFLSEIAGPDDVPGASEGFDEPCLVQLAGGEIMCVSRVGAGEDQKLARTYTSDGGRTWSKLDRLPAHSVAPQMLRLSSGVLVLSTGRPGIGLWLSHDARGRRWQAIDVLEHHNATLDRKLHIAHSRDLAAYAGGGIQTTAYTAMVEVSPNRVLLVYDRVPRGWEGLPKKSTERSQIFLLEVDIR